MSAHRLSFFLDSIRHLCCTDAWWIKVWLQACFILVIWAGYSRTFTSVSVWLACGRVSGQCRVFWYLLVCCEDKQTCSFPSASSLLLLSVNVVRCLSSNWSFDQLMQFCCSKSCRLKSNSTAAKPDIPVPRSDSFHTPFLHPQDGLSETHTWSVNQAIK